MTCSAGYPYRSIDCTQRLSQLPSQGPRECQFSNPSHNFLTESSYAMGSLKTACLRLWLGFWCRSGRRRLLLGRREGVLLVIVIDFLSGRRPSLHVRNLVKMLSRRALCTQTSAPKHCHPYKPRHLESFLTELISNASTRRMRLYCTILLVMLTNRHP